MSIWINLRSYEYIYIHLNIRERRREREKKERVESMFVCARLHKVCRYVSRRKNINIKLRFTWQENLSRVYKDFVSGPFFHYRRFFYHSFWIIVSLISFGFYVVPGLHQQLQSRVTCSGIYLAVFSGTASWPPTHNACVSWSLQSIMMAVNFF